MTTPTLTIDVYFDLICPWCLIGKRNLENGLQLLRATRPDIQPAIAWHSVPLLPDTPLVGLPYQSFYEKRLGGPQAVAARRSQVREAGLRAGIEFAFEKISVMPNTLSAHALIGQVAQSHGVQQAEHLIEALFQAYFMAGRDIGDVAILLDIAGECGCSASLQQLTAAGLGAPAPSEHSVSGVPFYVFNGRFALSGAQAPTALCEAMLRSLE